MTGGVVVRTCCLSVVLLVLSGCFASLDRTKPIVVEQGWIEPRYSQQGDRLNVWRMVNALEAEEAARPHVERWRRNYYGALATGLIGGASLVLGMEAMNGRDQTGGWFLVGLAAALWLPSNMMSSASISAVQDAVDAHNSSLRAPAPQSAGTCELRSPWIAVLPDGRGGSVQVAGLNLAF